MWYNEVSRPPLCVIESKKFELNAKTVWQKCSPTRFGVPSKLVWFPNAQRRAGRPRSSPSPLRGGLIVV
ncbi:MAG: hypothetical protein LBQ66_11520 [Planctomycetaceae bacterium]|nr:hypothetical protein [Planctomycetaceae bacterium]